MLEILLRNLPQNSKRRRMLEATRKLVVASKLWKSNREEEISW